MNIDRDDEYATRYEMTEPTIEKVTFEASVQHIRNSLVCETLSEVHPASLVRALASEIVLLREKLAALESQPVPVEPVDVSLLRIDADCRTPRVIAALAHIDSLQSALKLAQSEAATFEAAYKPEAQRADKAESLNRRMVEQYRDLVVAAKKAQEAMNVWVNTYAPEFCDKEHVENSRKIISESGGTLAYIADINEQIHEALAKLEEA